MAVPGLQVASSVLARLNASQLLQAFDELPEPGSSISSRFPGLEGRDLLDVVSRPHHWELVHRDRRPVRRFGRS